MTPTVNDIYVDLNKLKGKIPTQTYRTIVGQIRAGDLGGATVGINRLKKRMEKEAQAHENRCCK